MIVLKENPYRSVFLEDSGPQACVLKRFHHPQRLRAWRDGARARREYRALLSFQSHGLPVPRPIEIGRDDGGHYYRMQAIEGALSLETLFFGQSPPIAWEPLMDKLGQLLARLQGLGLVHPDLHPGNLLLDSRGEPYLVDLGGARLRGRAASLRQCTADLVNAEADARDYLRPSLRLRFARAWRSSSQRNEALDWGRIEKLARRKRRSYVEHGAGRWMRRSSRCSEDKHAGGVTFSAKLNPGFQAVPRLVEDPRLQLEGTREELTRAWLFAARCVEHRLPVVWPSELKLHGGHAQACFVVASSEGLELPSQCPSNLDALQQAFRRRGLNPGQLKASDLIPTVGGGYLLRPPQQLLALD